ncbi:SMP-30/gluconolactonase/LRE family protein [Arthrobacter sp. NPDC058288]|uniref:SMP-30/gluconolactonase/LRE family protein n=1 Tax=Arthrobacter sp. NPDC058288 TaxID=3346424 RepID=UPI0036E79E07
MRYKNVDSAKAIRRAAVGLVALAALIIPAPLASASPPSAKGDDKVIELPGASSAEGIAEGEGTTFFAGDLFKGDIFRGDIRRGTARLYIDVPDGRMAVGMKVDVENGLLFVAGGTTGQAYVYDTDSGKTVATYQLTTQPAFINDVAVTPDGAWFTNSLKGELYFVPADRHGKPGEAKTLELTGPAAATPGDFNLNGIAAVRGGRTLIVAHTANEALYTVDPESGSSAEIAGAKLPNVDGIVARGNTLWAVQNMLNQVSRVRLDSRLDSFEVRDVITSPDFQVPTTAALFGGTLAVVNAKFGVPGASTFEVVLTGAR